MKRHLLLKQATAMVLSIVLVLTTIPMVLSAESTNMQSDTTSTTELDVWDGTTQTKPSKGTGTEEDPYLISTPEELAYLNAVYVGSYTYYKLTADIYLNDITKINWQDGTVADGYTVNQWYKNATPNWFSGVLDGDGHTVYGMYVTDETNDIHLGLLQGTKNNSETKAIKNLGVDYAYVNAPNGDAAAFIGLTQSGTATFDTCYVGTNVTLNGANAGSFCGRAGTSLIISRSYSLAIVTGTTRYGAAVGDCWGGTRTIENSFFINAPITSHTGHGFTCTNVYATDITGAIEGATKLTSDNMQGYNALTNASKMPALAECGAFTATSIYPVLTNFISLMSDDSNQLDLSLDFEETYLDSSDNLYYDDTAENWSANNGRGSNAEAVTEADGNHAVRLTYDSENNNENYNANAVLNIYNPATKSKFVGTEGVKYNISFDYKVEQTDGQELQLFVTPSNREKGYPYPYAFINTDMGPKAVIYTQTVSFTEASDIITDVTEDWVHTSVTYTAMAPVNEHSVYPIILLQTNGKSKDASTTDNYASVLIDNIEISLYDSNVLDFEETYLDSSNNLYYDDTAENWSANNSRGSNAEAVTEADGNHAVRLTYDSENNNENYNANAVLNIYDPATKSKFVGTEGVKYTISFDYKVENTDDKELQLFIAPSNRVKSTNPAFKGTDMGPKAVISNTTTTFTEASGVITDATEDWVHTRVSYVAMAPVNERTVYPIIILQTNGKSQDASATDNYASVLIDNIKIELTKSVLITFYNYDGSDRTLDIGNETQFADLAIPSRKGYVFDGWYTDSEYTQKADDDEFVSNYGAIYVKWSGNGEAMTPYKITDSFDADLKKFNFELDEGSTPHQISYVRNSMIDAVGSASVSGFYGSYVFSSESTVTNNGEKIRIDGLGITNPTSNTVMFYVELPDFEKSGAEWGLAVDRGICIRQDGIGYVWTDISSGTNPFDYSLNNEWVNSTISSNGVFTGLPSGYKGYIRIDFSELTYLKTIDFTSDYMFNTLELKFNALGGENGDAILGGLLYLPKTKSESTVMKIDGLYYELSKSSEAIVVNAYDAKSQTDSSFSTRYTGTVGQAAVKYADISETSAFWSSNPAVITTNSGKAETTTGYMTTYINNKANILMQPGVDTVMFYVEMPVFNQSNTSAGLKLLDSMIEQGDKAHRLSFANSIYEYADVTDASWKIARAGADGDLFDIPSGFKGYIKFDIKKFKNIEDVKAVIDFSDLYYITRFELGFNHIGGENGNLVIGGVYSVINDSNAPFIKNGKTIDKRCFKVIAGDFDCNGTYNAEELVLMRRTLLGMECELSASAKLRENFDIRTLVRAKKVIAGIAKADISVDFDNGAIYREIFTEDTVSDNQHIIYSPEAVTDFVKKIEADTSLNSNDKAINFSNEINNNKIGDFEKIGIDKMCHVSTFLYVNNNIYISYYANTISATENPRYQVARFAYAPENNTDAKVVLDIMQVGDDLYGHKVTGVYDTILMQKDDEPNNIYILWTASINGKYYRLYRIFDLVTQELGEIGVNRFKVGDVTNDFSSSGMINALAANGIGYKTFFSDIGIMQKLSMRVEDGVTYYYTGTYSGNFTCIIKSKDLITWEYVAQPNEGANGTGFANATKWENAVYVLGDKVYYFVRQWDAADSEVYGSNYGILTCYDLTTKEWAKPILVGDCQSRSDFIYYKGNLYLFYAPTDRNHIGILKINTDDINETEVVLQADMNGSCFYPFVQYDSNGELCMSYTVDRKHIRLASFTLSNYID